MAVNSVTELERTQRGCGADRAAAELRQDAAERPDVDLVAVREAQDDLGRAVAARLHVAAQVVRCEAAAAQVDHLDLAPRVALHQNVLRLQVAVEQAQAVQEVQRLQDLDRDALRGGRGEAPLKSSTDKKICCVKGDASLETVFGVESGILVAS